MIGALLLCGLFGLSASLVLRAAHAPPLHFAWIGIGLLGYAVAHRFSAPPREKSLRSPSTPLIWSARTATTGALLSAISLYAPHLPPARITLLLGGLMATLSGQYALTHTVGAVGVLERKRPGLVHGSWLLALGFGLALVVEAQLRTGETSALVNELTASTLASAAGMGALALLPATALVAERTRSLELGASERLMAFAWLALTWILVAAAASMLRLMPAQALLPAAAAAAGAVAALAANTEDARRLSRAGALVLAYFIVVAPVVLLFGFLVRTMPHRALEVTALAAALAGGLGLFGQALAARILGAQMGWQQALIDAKRGARFADPDDALIRALMGLRTLSEGGSASPCLITRDPPQFTVVDRAGYPQHEIAEAPNELYEVSQMEHLGVAQLWVLEEAAVRHRAAKAAYVFMESRDYAACVLLRDEEHPIGLLCLPRLGRREPLSLVEVSALHELAEDLAGRLAASTRIARALQREQDLRDQTRELLVQTGKLEGELSRAQDRSEALIRALASRAKLACYAPASRLAVQAVEQLAQTSEPICLLVPAGVDPLPHAALFHVASSRAGGGLRLADGGSPELAELALWRDAERSPLSRAEDGTLVLVDPDQLPREVQRYLANAMNDRVSLVVVISKTLDVLVAEDRLAEELCDQLGGRTIQIPELAMRAEDLRSLVLHHLSRLGRRHQGGPLGIAPSALALLVEHSFVCNEIELETILTRAVLRATGEVIEKEDLAPGGRLS